MEDAASEDDSMSLAVIVNTNYNFCKSHSATGFRCRLSYEDQVISDVLLPVGDANQLWKLNTLIPNVKHGDRLYAELISANREYIYDVWRPRIVSKYNSTDKFTDSPYERKVIYIHPPKTGGYSAARRLRDSLALSPDISLVWQLSHFSIQEMMKHIPQFNPDNYMIVVTVRNPYERLYSMWKFNRHANLPEIAKKEAASASFEDFVLKYVEKIYERLQINDWIRGAKVVFPIWFERYEESFKELCDIYGFENFPQHLNNNPYFQENEFETVPPYTPAMREVVESLFKEDLEMFNYSYVSFVEDWLQKKKKILQR